MMGNMEFAAELLQGPGDFGDLLHAVSRVAHVSRTHELEVVDNEEIETVFHLEAAGFCAEFRNGGGDGVVDEDVGLRKFVHDRAHVLEVGIVELAALQFPRIDAEEGGEETVDELFLAHFQREYAHALMRTDCGILRDIQRQRGFSPCSGGRQG